MYSVGAQGMFQIQTLALHPHLLSRLPPRDMSLVSMTEVENEACPYSQAPPRSWHPTYAPHPELPSPRSADLASPFLPIRFLRNATVRPRGARVWSQLSVVLLLGLKEC